MAITQKDVAEHAGVTRSVVSHVLHGGNGTIRVSAETADRIRQSAAELGYRPSALARNFRTQRTAMIGVLHGAGFPRIPFAGGSQYMATLMDGIVDGAFRHGYTVALCPDLFGPEAETAMGDGRFDGFIWYSTFMSPGNQERVMRCPAPMVVIHSHSEVFENRFPTVICDNDQGIGLALDHLASLGHRKIAFVYDGADAFSESCIRRDACVRRGEAQGLQISVVNVNGDASGLHPYFQGNPEETAIIAHGDQFGADAMRVAAEYGRRVPEDLSVIGFDSLPFCEMLHPRLTAVSQPLQKMGEIAVDQLVKILNGAAPDRLETVLPCGFDIRESTGPVRS